MFEFGFRSGFGFGSSWAVWFVSSEATSVT